MSPSLAHCRGMPGHGQCLCPGVLSLWMFAGLSGQWKQEQGRAVIPGMGSSWILVHTVGQWLCPPTMGMP